MDAFAPTPPKWTNNATHAFEFCCPTCNATSREAEKVWVNKRAPVFTPDHRRKWQEFYQCHCGCVWWAWSSDRPPSDLSSEREENS
ncbi:hypothetical protein [Mastigocoleus sp. MO_188.B34]|uniref:hypothetical protein n=1 Tax=Mastigocoleus sp. MO_188.B34 TaxID=3036635 RepID=UPI002636944A|nr:hypothetical protein [Mastigocoleus sp. MO_188.B34]MDJ0697051.1 hypothetical protein [Mastigocoleus sp. MO_188.B34]